MKLYVGMDLHATNTYVGMVDEENTVLHKQRFRNELPLILAGLDPFKKDIEGVVVESTFNWYWLVDGLMAEGYRVHLANVSAIKQYEGIQADRRSAERLLARESSPVGYSPYRLHLPERGAAHQRPPPQEAPSRPPPDLPYPERQEHPRPEPGLTDEERGHKEDHGPGGQAALPRKRDADHGPGQRRPHPPPGGGDHRESSG